MWYQIAYNFTSKHLTILENIQSVFNIIGFIDIEEEDTGVNVILLIFIVVGILIGSLIFVGVIYNCIKRHNQGRHLFSGKHIKDSISFKEVDQSEKDSDSESNCSKERRGSIESEDSRKMSDNSSSAKETKVDITVEKEEISSLLETEVLKSEINNQDNDSNNVKSTEDDMKHIDED